MRRVEIVRCDGCGNVVTSPDEAWEWENEPMQSHDYRWFVVSHPNPTCARKAKGKFPEVVRDER